jgi:hypothetical protein
MENTEMKIYNVSSIQSVYPEDNCKVNLKN